MPLNWESCVPPNMALDTIRVYAITELDWIKIQ